MNTCVLEVAWTVPCGGTCRGRVLPGRACRGGLWSDFRRCEVGTFLSLHKFEIDPVWEELDRRVLESFIRGFFKPGNFESRNRKKHSRRKRSRSTWLALVSATSIKQRVVTSINERSASMKRFAFNGHFEGEKCPAVFWRMVANFFGSPESSSPRSPPSSFLKPGVAVPLSPLCVPQLLQASSTRLSYGKGSRLARSCRQGTRRLPDPRVARRVTRRSPTGARSPRA